MSFIPFFLLILVTIVFSSIFMRFHLPWVLALIVAGLIVGPFGLAWIEMTPTLTFMADIGLIFLMFIAGLQTKLSTFQHFEREVGVVTLMNGVVPFATGYLIGYFFDYSLLSSLLLGTIFMSSSIAVVIPALEQKGILQRKLGHTIVTATMINDIASLVLLSILLQTVDPISALPLPSFYLLVITILVGLRYVLPKIRALVPRFRNEQDLFESEVRLIFAMLFGTVVLFEALGLHPIIAGFFSGLVLSDSLTSEILLQKLYTIGYGIFIPVFFVSIGLTTDLGAVLASAGSIWLVVLVVVGSIGAKFVSGYYGALWGGFTRAESLFVGVATTPQLSTTLAVVVTATALELVPATLLSAMVFLSAVSTVVAPTLMRWLPAK